MKVTRAYDEQDGDWEAIYVDGVCKDQNHSLDVRDVLDALGIEFENIAVPGSISEKGYWSDDLEELKKDIKECQ
jgi:hypothetical protein